MYPSVCKQERLSEKQLRTIRSRKYKGTVILQYPDEWLQRVERDEFSCRQLCSPLQDQFLIHSYYILCRFALPVQWNSSSAHWLTAEGCPPTLSNSSTTVLQTTSNTLNCCCFYRLVADSTVHLHWCSVRIHLLYQTPQVNSSLQILNLRL